MSDFFEMPQMPDEMLGFQQRYRMPEWMGAPENVLPVLVPLELTIGRSEEAVVHIASVRAYPAGWTFQMISMNKPSDDATQWTDPMMMHNMHMHGMPKPGAALPDELMRFGFEFADGSKVTSLEGMWGPGDVGPDGVPQKPILQQGGGGGGGGRYVWDYWCWPLPPGDAITVVCEWPAFGIARTETTIDAAAIREAAARAEDLWPDDAPLMPTDWAAQSATEQIIPRDGMDEIPPPSV